MSRKPPEAITSSPCSTAVRVLEGLLQVVEHMVAAASLVLTLSGYDAESTGQIRDALGAATAAQSKTKAKAACQGFGAGTPFPPVSSGSRDYLSAL